MLEWGPDNVRVNTICPWARSDYWDGLDDRERAARLRRNPLRRIGEPEADVGGVVVFLASDAGVVRDRPDHPRRRREHGLSLVALQAGVVRHTRAPCPALYRPFTKRWMSDGYDFWCEAGGPCTRESPSWVTVRGSSGGFAAACVGVATMVAGVVGASSASARRPRGRTHDIRSAVRRPSRRHARETSLLGVTVESSGLDGLDRLAAADDVVDAVRHRRRAPGSHRRSPSTR